MENFQKIDKNFDDCYIYIYIPCTNPSSRVYPTLYNLNQGTIDIKTNSNRKSPNQGLNH